jgi:hypothetical protein
MRGRLKATANALIKFGALLSRFIYEGLHSPELGFKKLLVLGELGVELLQFLGEGVEVWLPLARKEAVDGMPCDKLLAGDFFKKFVTSLRAFFGMHEVDQLVSVFS